VNAVPDQHLARIVPCLGTGVGDHNYELQGDSSLYAVFRIPRLELFEYSRRQALIDKIVRAPTDELGLLWQPL
jgi:hypothetical protein